MSETKTNNSKAGIIVGIPAYNEEKYISGIVLLSLQYAEEVIVVDDGSHDRTVQIAAMAGATVVRHEQNLGYGHTIRQIITQAKQRNSRVLVILDADAQHDPDEIPRLVDAVNNGADIVIGSRASGTNGVPHYRRFGQKILTTAANFTAGTALTDTESGFRAYSNKAINSLNLKEPGMAVSAEIIYASQKAALVTREVPINVTYHSDGSTLNPIVHGLGVLSRIISMMFLGKPLIFFIIPGILLAIAGIVLGVIVINGYNSTGVLAVGTALITLLLIIIGALSCFTGVLMIFYGRR